MSKIMKSEVAQLFAEQGVVLVHCSSRIRMFGVDRNPPLARLLHVLDTKCDVPASTVRIEDTYTRQKYLGHLGLILDPVLFANISVSWHEDAGSHIDKATSKRSSHLGNGHNTPKQIKDAICNRGMHGVQTQYNEICCSNFEVIGLFADTEQPSFEMKAPLPGTAQDISEMNAWTAEGGMQIGLNNLFQYQIDTVGERFPTLPLFLWQPQSGTFEVKEFDRTTRSYSNRGEKPIAISDVYGR